jgi:nicotinamide mononucleotide (NMN) deamidase PncC
MAQPCTWETLATVGRRVGELLLQSGDTIAISESATGGLASAALLAVPGASGFYKAAHVAYTGEAQAAYTPATLKRTSERALKYGGRDFVLARAAEVRGDFGAVWGSAETSQTGPTFNAVRASQGGGRTDPTTGKAEKVAASKGEARAWVAVAGPEGLEVVRPERNEGVIDREANMFTFAQRLQAHTQPAVACVCWVYVDRWCVMTGWSCWRAACWSGLRRAPGLLRPSFEGSTSGSGPGAC